MSDQGEKMCPLCAEEMDLTDQQLKPCKCGYEICVWCWHHIMGMAEKDDTEGRCPACRTPYDKEKIVGAAKCERLVAEIHTERKKSQKTKVKPTSDGRKQLSSVRVIQRNLVYIVGLPLNLADEDLLQRREYFAQYGKVLKVSMSRTAAGVIQQFPNNTCSVYITYSKEEEAVRCIQNVHGFLLDGRSLRACFGTTKYCHAWLRNVPCTNPDCLYLHEVGCHEDSFTKDEIISAYTRSRVQQITGTLNPMQRRSGSVLPPPLDDYCNSISASAGGTVIKNCSNNTGSFIKGSPPDGSSGRSIALPAAASWGTRGSNSQPPATQIIYSNGHTKQRPDTVSCTVPFSSAAAPTAHASIVHSDVGKRSTLNDDSQTMHAGGKPESLKILKQQISVDSQSILSDKPAAPDEAPASVNVSSQLSCPQASRDNNRGSSMQPTISTATDHNRLPFSSCCESESIVSTEGVTQSLCSDISLMSIDRNSILDHSGVVRPNNSPSDNLYIKSPRDQGLQQYCAEQSREPPITTERTVTREQSNWLSESQPLPSISSEVEEDVLSFDNQRLKDPEVNRAPYLTSLPNAVHVPNHSRSPLLPSEAYGAVYSNADRLFVDNKIRNSSLLSSSNVSVQANGYHENLVSSSSGSERPLEHSFLHRNEGPGKHGRRFLGDAVNPDFCNAVDKGESSIISNADRLFVDNKIRNSSLLSSSNVSVQANGYHENLVSSSSGSERPLEHSFLHRNEGPGKHGRRFLGDAVDPDFCNAVDKGESSIISNILSMDFDTWDDPISSPQNFSKFLGESDRQSGAQKMSSSWKVPNNNQSRFSFARQEDSRNQAFDLQSSQNVIGRLSQNQAQNHNFHHGFSENRDLCLDNLGIGNGFPSSTFEESENHASNLLAFSSNKLSASRAQISAPPGFSVPSRAPPPGFTSHERVDRDFDSLSGNHLLDNSSLLRNAYQPQPTGNIGTSGDIEFMDPAILAVGKGRLQGGLNNPGVEMRSNFPSQLSAFENDARLQLLMQRSFSQQQNLRYPDFGDGFSHVNDSYGISSRLLDQSQASNISPFAQLSLLQSRNNRSMSNGHWDGWNEVQGGNTMGMAELLRNERVNERLGFNKFYSGYEESKFRMPNSGDLYN